MAPTEDELWVAIAVVAMVTVIVGAGGCRHATGTDVPAPPKVAPVFVKPMPAPAPGGPRAPSPAARDNVGRMQLRDPWFSVAAADAAAFDKELALEVTPGHPLWGRGARAVARRNDVDDVLYALDGGHAVAVVHLTWSGRPERSPEWPATRIYDSAAACWAVESNETPD